MTQAPQKANSRRLRLRTTLVVPFLLQIAAAVGLVGYLSFRAGQRAVNDLGHQLTQATSTRIDEHVITYLDQAQNILRLNSASVKSGNLNLDDFVKLRRYFWQVVHPGDLAGYLSYGDEQGNFVGVEYRGDGTVQLKIRTPETSPIRNTFVLDAQGEPDKLLAFKEYDPRTRPWYEAAAAAGSPTWSEIYPFFSSANTILGISPVSPVYDDAGDLIGVLCINVRLTRITDFIDNLFISPNGQSFIIERSGELVASSQIEQPFEVYEDENGTRKINRIPAIDSANPVVQAAAQTLLDQFGQFEMLSEGQLIEFKVGNEWYFAHAQPIQDGRGINWLTVVVVPERDFLAQIQQNTRNTIVLCLLAFAIAIGVGILAAHWITRPIQQITAASQKMADGDLDQQVKDDSRIVELESLAQSFNSMADQLKGLFTTLEDKVKARTAELAGANEQITALNEKLKAENLRLGMEVEVARQIQQMILPKTDELAQVPGLDIAGYMMPADEVGGDYYDVLQTDGVVTLGIGDVTGHGLESGLLMLMTQTAVRTLQEVKDLNPIRFLDILNRTIYQNVQRMNSEKNLTLSILNYVEKRVRISGQHEEALIVRENGTVERIDTMDLGLPIGLVDDIADFVDHTTIELQRGDGVVLYTDGIPEAYNLDDQQYGLDRLCEVISQNWQSDAADIAQVVVDDVYQFIGAQKIFDDITLVVLKQQ
ncbi:MAG: SpoIIE family protein phosphatase [Cyanobacteria bacterium P01_H01_bin.15]